MVKILKNRSKSRNPLEMLVHFSAVHPFWILTASLVLAVVSVYYTIGHLEFKSSRNDLISITEPAVKRFKEISKDFGRMTHVIVVVEGYDPAIMQHFVKHLADRLEKEPDFFQNFFYQIDTSSLDGKKLLYLSEDELQDLKHKLLDYGELIEELSFTPRMSRILAFVNQKISEATVSHIISELLGGDGPDRAKKPSSQNNPVDPASEEGQPVDLSFLRSLLEEMRLALRPGYRFRSPWNTFFDSDAKIAEDGFLTSDDDRFLFMVLDLKERKGVFTKKQAALQRLRGHIHTLLKQYPGLSAGVTGEVALAADEMKQAFKDTLLATVLALAGIGLLFVLVFRQVFNPLLILIALVVAICWAFGWLTLTVGHLTILSVAFTPILLGLGVDFGIHLLARYNEERKRGQSFNTALERSYHYTGKAITAGAMTTALAFFAIMLADFRGIQELGFIAGCGVLLSLLSAFTVLPALLAVTEKEYTPRDGRITLFKRALQLLETLCRHPRWVLAGAAAISGFAAMALGSVEFDYNLLNLQDERTESVVWERKISEHSERSSWFALTTAATLDEVRSKENRFKSLPVVSKVNSLSDLIPKNQGPRIRSVRALDPIVGQFDFEMESPEPLDPDEILELLEKIKFKLRSNIQWDPLKKPEENEILLTRQALLHLIRDLKKSKAEHVRQRLNPFQKRLFQDFSKKFRLLKENTRPSGPIEEKDVPKKLRERFKGKSGDYLIQIYSEKNIWEKGPMIEFVDMLRAVEPSITGSPFVGYIAINLMKKGYVQGSIYAFLTVCMVVWVTIRRIRETCLALVPLALAFLWTLGGMGWAGIPFNLANVIALPLILGIVVDDGIHVTHRFMERPDSVQTLSSGSTAQAITLTSWTTMCGFGSLLISRHFGIFSLGLVVTLAVGTAWILSLILLPVILSYLGKR